VAQNDGQEKTEQPTGKKLEDARKKGQAAKSMEINSLVVFFSGFLLVYMTRDYLAGNIADFSKFIFNSLDVLEINLSLLKIYAYKGYFFFIITLLPILAGLVVIALAVSFGQVGFKISPEALMPKLSKIDPLKGMKNKFFSAQAVVELVKSLFKLIVIGGFIYYILPDLILNSIGLVDHSVAQILDHMVESSFGFIWRISLVFTVIAIGDFIFQKFKFKKDMMMSKQEVKDEFKQTEGDPLVKGHIKSKQLEMARSRMMQEVPKADVVITNPTHYAVALKYEVGAKSAPKIIAKGQDFVAQRIKKIAVEHGIPLHEDVVLARALYASCEVGEEIPEKLFEAVAKILAYIFKAKNKKLTKGIV